MVKEWLPKPSKNGSKKCIIFRSFFHRFLDRSWGPKSLKMSTSYAREANFHKIAFSDSDLFLEAKMMKKGSQNGAKMASKVNEKINAIFDSKNNSFWSQNGSKTEPKWRPKSWKFVDISGYPPKTPPGRPNGGYGAPKWSENGAQRGPTGEKMEFQASQNGIKNL